MIPRCVIGKGVTGAARYVLGEGRGAGNDNLAPGEESRVAWISGTGFGFTIATRAEAELATRIMEFDALNQSSPTRKCEKDAVHISLAWRPGEVPTREQMEAAARDALQALGMGNAKALFVSHSDEGYAHVHIVASKINPATDRAYDLLGNYLTLSRWAERYERDHGGIICLRRESANRLRDAIEAGDPGAVLEALTAQKPTFRLIELDRALGKQIKSERVRAELVESVLMHPAAVGLADWPGGPVMRYTSRAVLEAERVVLHAADGLRHDESHGLTDATCASVLGKRSYHTIRPEQALAVRHATGMHGLAIIDGQAGTGKSFTIGAVRECYEAAGCAVIGLAPTNAVAQDMHRDGFGRAATVHSELFALNNRRTHWGRRTVIIVDEAAMLDTKLMAALATHAHNAAVKLILVGDDRQLSSIEYGGMFGALKERYGAATLREVTRQHQHDDRRAASMMAEGNFHDALASYDAKGAITWTRTQEQARKALVERWAEGMMAAPEKNRFVFAYTNADVAQLNRDLRAVRRERGELGPDYVLPSFDGALAFAVGDRVQFTGTDKQKGLYNGTVGTVTDIDGQFVEVRLDGRQARSITFHAADFPKFRHGYAGTIYRGQGRTLDQTYLYHSEHWRSAASYVALTRHRESAELFVARNTARDLTQLARQMARTDDRRAASQFYEVDGTTDDGRSAAQQSYDLRQDMLRVATAVTGSIHAERAMQDGSGMDSAPFEAGHHQPHQMKPSDFQGQADRQVQQTAELEQAANRLAQFEADRRKRAEEAREFEEHKRRGQASETAPAPEIRDASDRYRVALAEHYDPRNPYSSLADAAMAEYQAFMKEREKLTLEIAKAQDAELRWGFELRKEILEADYMAITSRRIAEQSDVIAGHRNSDEAVKFRQRAAAHETRGKELRREYHEMKSAEPSRDGQPQDATQSDEKSPTWDAPNAPDQSAREREKEDAKRADERKSTPDAAPRMKTAAEKDAEAAADELTKGREVDSATAARIDKLEGTHAGGMAPERPNTPARGFSRGGRGGP